MMNVMVKLLQLVTKIKYLPVASCLLCVPLSQTIKCVQFKHPSSREQTNPSSPTGPRSARVSVENLGDASDVRLAEPQVDLRRCSLLPRLKCWGVDSHRAGDSEA